jgi:hypothetical protein
MMIKELLATPPKHIKDEESQDLPMLEAKLRSAQGKSEAILKSFSRMKAFIPSRSRPSASKQPHFETAMGLLDGSLQPRRRHLRKLPNETMSLCLSTK